jgi:hypothetical protein
MGIHMLCTESRTGHLNIDRTLRDLLAIHPLDSPPVLQLDRYIYY